MKKVVVYCLVIRIKYSNFTKVFKCSQLLIMVSLAASIIMLVGSYGTPDETNIRSYLFDTETGLVTLVDSLSGINNPTCLAFTDNGKTVMAVNQVDSYSSSLTMLRQDGEAGKFKPVAERTTIGKNPCHVAVSHDGKYAVTANYSSGTISVFQINGEENLIEKPRVVKFAGHGTDSIRQDMPHPHGVAFTPDRKFLVVTDLGTDRIHQFPLDEEGHPDLKKMIDVSVTPGFGPRHIVFDRKCENGYMVNTLTGQVSHFRYSTYHDTLNHVNSYPTSCEPGGEGADITISPDGRYVYLSNKLKGEGIAIFSVDVTNGWELVPEGYVHTGHCPGSLAISPDGNWLLVGCQEDNHIEVFKRNQKTGELISSNNRIPCPKPAVMVFDDTML